MKRELLEQINDLIDYIIKINNKFEKIQKKYPENVAFFLYIVLVTCIKHFHEPWFDEAQAWMIAKCATLKEIVFLIPHYEGHPPLWHLALMPFAKNGVAYEAGIGFVSLIFVSASIYLLVYKSPFPRIFRISLPFTYFFFYQYGVISRNYSIMMLAFVLTAVNYKTRNEKPFCFVLCLALLCSTSAYGIVISFGIVLSWLYEIIKSKGLKPYLFKDKRIFSLEILFIYALFLLIIIFPYKDTSAVNLIPENNFFDRILYILFIVPIDSSIYECFNNYGRLITQTVWSLSYIAGLLLGILFAIYMIILSLCYKKTSLFVLPYMCFSVFGAIVYFYTHHIGIVFLYLVFWFWTALDDNSIDFKLPDALYKLIKTKKSLITLKRISYLIISTCVVISVSWNLSVMSIEIKNNYGYAKEMANFIKKNNLADKKILSAWTDKAVNGINVVDTNVVLGIELNPYFNRNIILNLNDGFDKYGYIRGIKADDKTNQINFKKMREKGIPNVIIGDIKSFDKIYAGIVTQNEYVPVFQTTYSFIWKNLKQYGYINLYVHKSTAEQLGLPEIELKYTNMVKSGQRN